MKKTIAALCAAAALAVTAPAGATEIPPYAGTKRCPAPYTHGTVIWTDTPVTPYQEREVCFASGPGTATADDSDSARAGVTRCGAAGHYIVWYYDLNNEYQELWNSCI
ncbi:MAG TPA: hypothetical protein VG318_18470 [Actinomycetota bacterium]|nr:hypothetical protein [Actinomycetota bacterium]